MRRAIQRARLGTALFAAAITGMVAAAMAAVDQARLAAGDPNGDNWLSYGRDDLGFHLNVSTDSDCGPARAWLAPFLVAYVATLKD